MIFEVEPNPSQTYSNFNEFEPNRIIEIKRRTRIEFHIKYSQNSFFIFLIQL